MQNKPHPFNLAGTSSSNSRAVPCASLSTNTACHPLGLSVKTLRRWRQEQLGPSSASSGACHLPDLEVEAFERRVSRHSTFTRAHTSEERRP